MAFRTILLVCTIGFLRQISADKIELTDNCHQPNRLDIDVCQKQAITNPTSSDTGPLETPSESCPKTRVPFHPEEYPDEEKHHVHPALTPSLFSNVPPTINFVLPDEDVDMLNPRIRDLLKVYGKRNDIALELALTVGFAPTKDVQKWTLYFHEPIKSEEMEKYLNVSPQQKFRFIPDSWTIGCKDRLTRNLQTMALIHGGKEYDFYPTTFLLPADVNQLRQFSHSSTEDHVWIVKPYCYSKARGIYMTQKWQDANKYRNAVVQRYVPNPFLIKGYKFDLRIYVEVTSVDPLRIYIYPEGLVRFASEKFSMKNVYNKFAHLTNFLVNSEKKGFRIDREMQEGHTCGEADMRKAVKSYLKSRYSVHELFGFDVLLDANLKPWVLEVNVYPNLGRNFTKVHVPLLKDVLNLVGIQIPFVGNREFRSQLGPERKSSVPKHLTMDHRLWVQTLSAEAQEKHEYYTQNLSETQQQTILDNLAADDVRMLIETIDEDNRKGQFERIFPGPDTGKYLRFFEQPRYYNLLLHQWISRYHDNQEAGRDILESLCRQFKHVEA
ncbi:tubulin polyglutamylase TTLL4-like [Lingula anatina]|uniref:Tubulin polyglutamylase TTLL4-like n=1 Tax=Lingula anatina TaxID=7574 RepID=A0A1S3HVB2_LINAN|nr:tubulin polyglutamylase TTLL4-like [Lingula anatina]|eukprot:XP_013388994.1 tubulin polyglutamylase TTLL4-like [Lingula anatina]